MVSIAEKEIYCFHRDVRTTFTENDADLERTRLWYMRELFKDKGISMYFPVAVFAWKLLNITEIWEQKKPNFLNKHSKTS